MKIAVSQWQCCVEDRLSRIARDARQASLSGCDLLLLPELALPGYNRPDGHREQAQPLNGIWATYVAEQARNNRIAIVYGWAERGTDGIYNSVSVIAPDGTRLAHYRKIQLFGAMEQANFSHGQQAPVVFRYRGRNFGLLICYDIEFPEHARALARQGTEILLVPTANPIGYAHVPDLLVPARAYENRMVVAYANYSGEEHGLCFGGLSIICSPDGQPVAKAGLGDALLIAEIGDNLFEGEYLSTQIADLRGGQAR
ncbi:nitrilase-related carbon-nitrogen hydrolase [Thioclava sp. 'Guangxiensis']|uniref:nitrilase-related carbon-nitrogen hydrolase n=1 Tax=Thioclava sp. 'Guangxiensis' TaxID=3149044 RepID=UPI003877CFF7